MTTVVDRAPARLWVTLVISVVVIVSPVLLYKIVQQRLFPGPPDVKKVARSAAVSRADRTATTVLDSRMVAVIGFAPWLTPQAVSVADLCESTKGPFLASGYGPVTCTRTLTRYLAFDGDFVAQNTAWDRALQAAGWHPHSSMTQLLDRYRTAPDPRVEGLGPARYEYGSTIVCVITWAQRPQVPHSGGGLRSGQRPPDTDSMVYRTAEPVDVAATARDAFTRHQFLAIVTMSYRCCVATTPSPSPTLR